MSVPKSKRKQSEMEFYDHAKRLRITVTEWLLNDFGIRPRALAIPRLAKGLSMSDEDRDAILNVLDKYGLTKDVVELFPPWWIERRRITIDGYLAKLAAYIAAANKLYCTGVPEYWLRREWQDRAIACVNDLKEELQHVIDVLHVKIGVDVEKYIPIVAACEREIALLGGWRKSDYQRILRPLLEKERRAGGGKGCDLYSRQLVAVSSSQFDDLRECQQ